MTWWRKNSPPAQADTPAPGQNPARGAPAARPPWGPAPAPVPAREPTGPPAAPAPGLPRRHGGIAYSIRMWECGRIRIWDGNHTLTYALECACPAGADWHEWEEELSAQ